MALLRTRTDKNNKKQIYMTKGKPYQAVYVNTEEKDFVIYK